MNEEEAQALLISLWDGKNQKPVTADPIITIENNKVVITCDTGGASIGYKTNPKAKSWNVYSEPLELQTANIVIVQAHRIGYLPSKTITKEISK